MRSDGPPARHRRAARRDGAPARRRQGRGRDRVHRHGQLVRRLLLPRHPARGAGRPHVDDRQRRAAALPAGVRGRATRWWSPSASPARAPSWCGWPRRWRAARRPPARRWSASRTALDNTLAGRPIIALDTRAGEEHGPSTMTFAAALVVLCAVAGDGDGAAGGGGRLERLLTDARRGRRRPRRLARRPVGARADRPRLRARGRRDGRADAQGGRPAPGRVAADRPVPPRPAGAGRRRISPRWCSRPSRARATSTWGWPASWWRPGSPVLVVSQDGDAPDGARGLADRAAGRGHRPRGRHPPRAAPGLAARRRARPHAGRVLDRRQGDHPGVSPCGSR